MECVRICWHHAMRCVECIACFVRDVSHCSVSSSATSLPMTSTGSPPTSHHLVTVNPVDDTKQTSASTSTTPTLQRSRSVSAQAKLAGLSTTQSTRHIIGQVRDVKNEERANKALELY